MKLKFTVVLTSDEPSDPPPEDPNDYIDMSVLYRADKHMPYSLSLEGDVTVLEDKR
ncbi:hypothetical protein AB0J81_13640 [Streptomyces bobili]|uniref:hypothetical protein n=1 Tax=Streptomyces bobili TaxID=67280 RepID=UPI00341775DC